MRPCFLCLFIQQQYWRNELSWAFCRWVSSPARWTSHVPRCGSEMLWVGVWGGNGICWDCHSDSWVQNHVEPVLPREPGFRSVEGLSLCLSTAPPSPLPVCTLGTLLFSQGLSPDAYSALFGMPAQANGEDSGQQSRAEFGEALRA